MNNEIYEVERDDYVGFLGQLNKEKTDLEVSEFPGGYIVKIKSKKTEKHLSTRIIDNEKNKEVAVDYVKGLLQNNKLVGAVSHVSIEEPNIGYGVHIEWMLNDL